MSYMYVPWTLLIVDCPRQLQWKAAQREQVIYQGDIINNGFLTKSTPQASQFLVLLNL